MQQGIAYNLGIVFKVVSSALMGWIHNPDGASHPGFFSPEKGAAYDVHRGNHDRHNTPDRPAQSAQPPEPR